MKFRVFGDPIAANYTTPWDTIVADSSLSQLFRAGRPVSCNAPSARKHIYHDRWRIG
jgi:hypothetical protein